MREGGREGGRQAGKQASKLADIQKPICRTLRTFYFSPSVGF